MSDQEYFAEQARIRLADLGIKTGPRQPLEEMRAEIERLQLGISTVRGCIIGALAGGHMEGNDGANYSKQVLLFIADTLGISIPDIVKGEKQG